MTHHSDHTFVIPAYGESPYLEECIASLQRQSVQSQVLLTTSTPSEFLQEVCRKHGVEMRINPGTSSIASDWSFAYNSCSTRYVTIAHQDDVYYPSYTSRCLELAAGNEDAIMVFTDYDELVDSRIRSTNLILRVKRLILFCFFGRSYSIRSLWRKRYVLAFGSPVSCPTVLFHKARIGEFTFSDEYSVNLDWDAWRRLAERDGSFVYTGHRGMSHRIYAESQTSRGIQNRRRQEEDRRMFRAFWPRPISDLLSTLYTLSYRSNTTTDSGGTT